MHRTVQYIATNAPNVCNSKTANLTEPPSSTNASRRPADNYRLPYQTCKDLFPCTLCMFTIHSI